MTAEDLSRAAADRHDNRVMHEVRNTVHLRFPPQRPLTRSAREALHDDDHEAAVVSARTEETLDAPFDAPVIVAPPPPAHKKPTDAECVNDVYKRVLALEPFISTHLTPRDRRRLVEAIRGPSPRTRPEVVTVIVSALVLFITAMACLHNPTAHHHHRPRHVEPLSRAAAEVSSSTAFNIHRILTPLTRGRR